MSSRLSFGLAFAKDLKREEDSFLRVAFDLVFVVVAGSVGVVSRAGVDSLDDGFDVAVALEFSLPLAKKSLAVDDMPDGSFFSAGLASGTLGFTGCDLEGTGIGAATGGGGRRSVRRLTFLLIIVPYVDAIPMGSSALTSSCVSRKMSESICRS